MIRVQQLKIIEFRGIRDLKINFGAKNFAICGPNGTGKSGVVDAIEFALTGDITRLTGRGSSEVTVKAHAPHVDRRDSPGESVVVLDAEIPSLGKTVRITRRVSAATAPRVEPDSADVLAVIAELARHPEFALSRREIVKYVLATPGDRSKEVEELLRLDRLEKARNAFVGLANGLEKETKLKRQAAAEASQRLAQGLSIPSASSSAILAAVNTRRALLGLDALSELTATSEFIAFSDVGSAQATAGSGGTGGFTRKGQLLLDLANLRDHLSGAAWDRAATSVEPAIQVLQALAADTLLLRAVRQRSFLESGTNLIEESLCPFCDERWDVEDLREHIAAKLLKADAAGSLLLQFEAATQALRDHLRGAATLIDDVHSCCVALKQADAARELADLRTSFSTFQGRVEGPLEAPKELIALLLEGVPRPSSQCDMVLNSLEAVVCALPEPSDQEKARSELLIAQDRLETYRESKKSEANLRRQSDQAIAVRDAFNEARIATLTSTYRAVEHEFARLYRTVNREDEATFEGRLTPSQGKLGFDVDFYGRGFFPPGAYHSEGHQDGMGLCLYLALMKHTLGPRFTFAVLDDVLMSVDSGHRREVCSLLRTEFPNTQFILTTHDPIWLKHMETAKVLAAGSSLQFRSWAVDRGPAVWDHKTVWEEIDLMLGLGKVHDAASTLRRYLEYRAAELCHGLKAKVPYQGDAQYDLGDLLAAIVGRWIELLKRAEKAASSWGKSDLVEQLHARRMKFNTALALTQAERWQINPNVHFNEWAVFHVNDFKPVAGAFQALLSEYGCATCGSDCYVSPHRGPSDTLRCPCGGVMVNLKEQR